MAIEKLIADGNAAEGRIKQLRSRDYSALLKLKGKPINAARLPENCSLEVKVLMAALRIRPDISVLPSKNRRYHEKH